GPGSVSFKHTRVVRSCRCGAGRFQPGGCVTRRAGVTTLARRSWADETYRLQRRVRFSRRRRM
ncbi:MAG: hypothetical protein AVDCRST_MAG87-1595, partial [uncultured Thermomicrobiales bacterium]